MIKFGKPVQGDIEARLDDLTRRLAGDERVAAAWLFGSRARGDADALSDVDVAVLAAGAPEPEQLGRWQLDWIGVATETLGTEEVSLAVLNQAPVVFRHQALRGARLLFARSPELAADYELATIREYLDYGPSLEEYDRLLLAQAAAGRLR